MRLALIVMTSMLLALSLAPAAWAGAADSLDADEGSLTPGSGLPRELDDVSLKISGPGAGGRSSPVYVFNTTFQTLSVTVNGGPAFQLPGASFPYGLPVQPRDSVDFVASSPAKGQMSYGRNKLTADMYYGQPVAFNVAIPQTGPISTIQLYLFTDGAGVRWTALDSGRPIASGSSG